MHTLSFTKMHGLGNDFVVFDGRVTPVRLHATAARAIADRHRGVGCDQLIVIEPPTNKDADAFMRIRNADGGEVAACGNATRCVAAALMREAGKDSITIETASGLLETRAAGAAGISVDMGTPKFDWRDIPLSAECDTLHVPLAEGALSDPVCTNMGNPHTTFFVPDADAVDLATLGPQLEHHRIFPERANIGVAHILGPDHLRLRVWERGTGITLACGTGACAAALAAARRGLTGRQVVITVDGGALTIEWRADNHVVMTGPAESSFTGIIDLSRFD